MLGAGGRDRPDDRQHESASHGVTVALLALLAACRQDLDDLDGIFYDGDGRTVHCAANLDRRAGHDELDVEAALDRAAARGEVVELYAHKPGVTVPVERIELVLAGARARGLPFYTYADFASGAATGPGLALSFDDSDAAGWFGLRSLFQQYAARVTFFVSRYPNIGEEGHAQLRELHADGHDLAAHSLDHLRAPTYVEDNGLAAYLADEVVPSIDVLAAEGYTVTSFAYPFGARTHELDEAIAKHVPIVRAVSFPFGGLNSPCPR